MKKKCPEKSPNEYPDFYSGYFYMDARFLSEARRKEVLIFFQIFFLDIFFQFFTTQKIQTSDFFYAVKMEKHIPQKIQREIQKKKYTCMDFFMFLDGRCFRRNEAICLPLLM